MLTPGVIGEITKPVIAVLGLNVAPGTPILVGESNISHMMSKHFTDFAIYSLYFRDIIAMPDYVGINPGDGSIEYVKDFPIAGDFVKVAVRVSHSGNYYARSMYTLNASKVLNFIKDGKLKKP